MILILEKRRRRLPAFVGDCQGGRRLCPAVEYQDEEDCEDVGDGQQEITRTRPEARKYVGAYEYRRNRITQAEEPTPSYRLVGTPSRENHDHDGYPASACDKRVACIVEPQVAENQRGPAHACENRGSTATARSNARGASVSGPMEPRRLNRSRAW